VGKCTICSHEEREEIDRALVRGEGLRALARRYGASHSAMFRHKRDHIPAELALTAARAVGTGRLARATALVGEVERRTERGLNVMAELESTLRGVNKLFEACDDWLTDPEDPERYDLGPRAEELLVHYWQTGEDGERVRAKARLSELLERVAQLSWAVQPEGTAARAAEAGTGRIAVEGIEFGGAGARFADPRELILKAAKRLEAELQLVARLLGQLPGPAEQTAGRGMTVNVLVASPEWLTTRAAILAALEPYPEAREAVARAVRRAAAEG
jgi:hypothetical protein